MMKKFLTIIVCLLSVSAFTDLYAENNCMYEKLNSVHDYEYLKNTYFFASHQHRDRFEEGLSNDLLHFTLNAWTQIMDLQVWTSASSSDPDSLKGVAVVNPEKYTSKKDDQMAEKGYFKPLSSEKFKFDGDRGYFWLNEPADKSATIAISYVLKDKKQIGTMIKQGNPPDKVLLKLIKPANQTPSEKYKETWPLMMKNVYYIGKGFDDIKEINLKIKKVSEGLAKTGSKEKPSLNTFGLDMIDECRYYVRNGDGIIDFNSFNLDLQNGILIFPSLRPFNPKWESRFQLKERNKADIYDSTSMEELKANSKFKILVIDMMGSKSKETALNPGDTCRDFI